MRSSIPVRRVRPAAVAFALATVVVWLAFGGTGQAHDAQVPCYAAAAYPGDTASRVQIARWMGAAARAAGLPAELPVMAALADSGLRNRPSTRGADSVGYFQMRVSIWNVGEYKGFQAKPQLQLEWFIDSAIAAKMQRYATRAVEIGKDPTAWGEWIADVERPAVQLRGRYQLRLEEARSLLRGSVPSR